MYKPNKKGKKCRNCGREYPHPGGKKQKCPAKGMQCHNFKKFDHFASVCRGQKKEDVHALNQHEESDSDDYVFSVTRGSGTEKRNSTQM